MAEQTYATIADKKFLNSTGVGHLWEKIRDRYDAKLDSISATDDSVVITGGNSVNVQISAATGNLLELKTAAGEKGLYVPTPAAADTYAITKDSTSSDYAAVYRLKKYAGGVGDGVDAGVTINIPKDMVVSSGTVVTKDASGAWGAAGTYIELTLANATNDKLYIPVNGLIEYVTSGSTSADMVQVAIDSNHQVTATIKAGSITTTELDSSIVTSLGKADSAVQSVTEGATNGTIAVDGTDVAVHGLGTAAYTASTAYDAAGAAAAVLGTNEDVAGTVTVYGVKKYASDVYESITALSNNEIDAAIAAANAAIEA